MATTRDLANERAPTSPGSPTLPVSPEDSSEYTPIDFYASPKAVGRPFREIDTVTILGWGRNRDDLVEEAKERAREAGGEGIILLDEEPTDDGRMNYSSGTCESDDVLLRGVVIVYDEDGHLPPKPASTK